MIQRERKEYHRRRSFDGSPEWNHECENTTKKCENWRKNLGERRSKGQPPCMRERTPWKGVKKATTATPVG